MKFRSKINKNYNIKIKDIIKNENNLYLYLILVKNRKYLNKYIEFCFVSKYKRTKEKTKEVLKYSTNLIQTYDEMLKEKYDIEVY